MSATDVDLQDELLDTMGAASLCAFGRGAPMPVRSLMEIFAGDLAAART
jgi:NADH:ubiquinone oxidoreductase subunit F (NADH-binding)